MDNGHDIYSVAQSFSWVYNVKGSKLGLEAKAKLM
jgi:hypothetical protein